MLGSVCHMLGSARHMLGSARHMLGSARQMLGSVRQMLGSVRQMLDSVCQMLGSVCQTFGFDLKSHVFPFFTQNSAILSRCQSSPNQALEQVRWETSSMIILPVNCSRWA